MNEPTLLELIREYGRTMEVAGRYDAVGNVLAGEKEIRAARLYDEIERRIATRPAPVAEPAPHPAPLVPAVEPGETAGR